MRIKIFLAIITWAILMIVSCKHHPDISEIITDPNGGIPNPPDTVVIINTDPCDPDTVYFTNTILPIFIQNCAMEDCHDAVDPEEDLRLYSYDFIMEEITPFDLEDSEIWETITDDDEDDVMPPLDEGGPLSAEDIAAIQTWILQGAQNNSCQPDCDPTQGSFAANILPIVQQTCQGNCHAGGSPSGDLSLETYDQIRATALDGSLMHALLGTNNYALMPDNTTGLPECYITQFQNWVNAGAPNN